MNLKRTTYRWMLTVFAVCSLFTGFAQEGPLSAVSRFFDACTHPDQFNADLFSQKASIRVIAYDQAGQSSLLEFSPESYANEIQSIHDAFDFAIYPVVLVEREYGPMATFFCSVASTFVDGSTQDTFYLKSIYSFNVVDENGWKVASLVSQPEVASHPLSKELWPSEITSSYEVRYSNSSRVRDDYDPNQVFNPEQVDIRPEYPAQPEVFNALMQSFDVTNSADDAHTPFTVIVQEDGLAELGYVGDLSGDQIKKAKDFVASMLVWYPAILEEASVSCKLIFYVQ